MARTYNLSWQEQYYHGKNNIKARTIMHAYTYILSWQEHFTYIMACNIYYHGMQIQTIYK